MRKIILFILLAVQFIFIQNLFAKDISIRVAIIQDAENIRATVKGPYVIQAVNSQEVLLSSEEDLKYALVTPTALGVDVGKSSFKVYGIKIIPKSSDVIYINGSPFKGNATIIRKENMKLLVVNNLNLEDYLKGVLYHEVSHLWPLEVLKAQAVAARTFAMYQIENRGNYEFDVTSDIYSQVYGGSYSEKERPNLAVAQTKGLVLTYKNKIFPAYFHAVCAGHTEDASVLWKNNIKPLKGVVCEFCKISPHYSWEANLSLAEVQEKLSQAKLISRDITDIKLWDFTRSGRVKRLKIILSPKKSVIISAKDFRQALNPRIIKSTNFSLAINNGIVRIEGKGWGHGVGLCQWGAFYQAAKGKKFDEILEHYYPGAKITQSE